MIHSINTNSTLSDQTVAILTLGKINITINLLRELDTEGIKRK